MFKAEVGSGLKDFISREFLNNDPAGLDFDTPLIELKVIDSVTTVLLVNYISESFGVEVPLEELTESNFSSIRAIDRMVARLATGLVVREGQC